MRRPRRHDFLFAETANGSFAIWTSSAASASQKVAAYSVAFTYSGANSFIYVDADNSALSQTSAGLMKFELAGGHFKLTLSNFKL